MNLTGADRSSSLGSLTRASKGHGKRKKKDQRELREKKKPLANAMERKREILKQEECRDDNELDSSESARQRLGRSSPLCIQE